MHIVHWRGVSIRGTGRPPAAWGGTAESGSIFVGTEIRGSWAPCRPPGYGMGVLRAAATGRDLPTDCQRTARQSAERDDAGRSATPWELRRSVAPRRSAREGGNRFGELTRKRSEVQVLARPPYFSILWRSGPPAWRRLHPRVLPQRIHLPVWAIVNKRRIERRHSVQFLTDGNCSPGYSSPKGRSEYVRFGLRHLLSHRHRNACGEEEV